MNYMGSKEFIADYIVEIINTIIKDEGITTYIEPFVGGCNVANKVKCREKIASDINEYLIEMFVALKYGWVPPEHVTEEQYRYMRDHKDEFSKADIAVVGFCGSFNNKWWDGYCRRDGVYEQRIKNVINKKDSIQDIEFVCADYRHYTNIKGALIYCDPPYESTKDYKIKFSNKEFIEWVREMSKSNIVLVSEYNTPVGFNNIFEKEVRANFYSCDRKINKEIVCTLNSTKYIDMLKQKYNNNDSLDDMI